MAHLLLAAITLAGGAAAAAPDAHAVLEAAAAAMQAVRTARYEGRLEMEAGGSTRVVEGTVRIARFEYSDPVGAMLSVEGVVGQTGREARSFHVAYDGEVVRRLMDGDDALVKGEPGYGGEGLLTNTTLALVIDPLLEEVPLSSLQAASAVSSGPEDVDGVACDVVEITGDEPGSIERWSFAVADHLPRRILRRYRSARGTEVESVLVLRDLIVNEPIDPAVFRIDAPQGVRVETVGRKPPPSIDLGQIAPDWELTDVDGRTHRLSDHRGKVVLLDFWATWCDYCNRALPAVQALHDTYGDRGLVVYGVNCKEKTEDVDATEYLRARGFTYPVLVDGNRVIIQWRVRGIPVFYVIGPDGRVIYRDSGYSDAKEAALIRAIESSLSGL